MLRLSYLRINDLKGLGNIPNIQEVLDLELNDNRLSELQPNAFNGLNNLIDLTLTRNRLKELLPNAFNGLNNLKYLYFIENQITQLPPNIFNGLNNLTFLELSYNKLEAAQKEALRKSLQEQLPEIIIRF